MLLRLLCVTTLLGLLVGSAPAPAAADPISEAKRLLASITQRRETSIERLEDIKQQEQSAANSLRQVEGELYKTISRVAAAETALQKIEVAIRGLEAQQEVHRSTLAKRGAAYGARLRALYKFTQTSPLELILGASDFGEALQRLNLITVVAREDTRLAVAVQQQYQSGETIRQQLDEKMAEAAALRDQVEAAQQALARQRAQQRQLVAQIQAEEQRTQSQVTDWDRQAQALSRQIRRLVEAERQRLEALARRRQEEERRRALGLPVEQRLPGVTGPFMWPVRGRITALWGEPTFAQVFHTGIDIGVPIYTPVRAARSGIVISSGYAVPGRRKASYGMMVIVAHDAEHQTVYAHLDDRRSPPRVRQGQEVRQGTILGVIGMTGITSGPHLHFEVRRNGTFRNPMEFLQR